MSSFESDCKEVGKKKHSTYHHHRKGSLLSTPLSSAFAVGPTSSSSSSLRDVSPPSRRSSISVDDNDDDRGECEEKKIDREGTNKSTNKPTPTEVKSNAATIATASASAGKTAVDTEDYEMAEGSGKDDANCIKKKEKAESCKADSFRVDSRGIFFSFRSLCVCSASMRYLVSLANLYLPMVLSLIKFGGLVGRVKQLSRPRISQRIHPT